MHKASISQNCQVQQRFCKLQLVYLLYGNVCLHILARTCKAAACSGTHSSDSSEPKCFTPPLYFAKFTFSEMLPTALPYHTPAKLSRAFFVRRHTTGQQRQGSSPTPRPPQGGGATSGVWRQGKPAVYRHPKNCTAALDNNKRLWYSIGATDGVWRESVRTSKRANPRGLALFLLYALAK